MKIILIFLFSSSSHRLFLLSATIYSPFIIAQLTIGVIMLATSLFQFDLVEYSIHSDFDLHVEHFSTISFYFKNHIRLAYSWSKLQCHYNVVDRSISWYYDSITVLLLWKNDHRKFRTNVRLYLRFKLATFISWIAKICYFDGCKYAGTDLLSWIQNCHIGFEYIDSCK